MKYYILILSMIIGSSCYGQYIPDSLKRKLSASDEYWRWRDSVMTTQDTMYLLENGWMKGQVYLKPDFDSVIYHRKRDTVSCLMLICDTSYGLKPSGFISIRNDTLHYDSVYFPPRMKVEYGWGYSVRELYNLNEVEGNPNAFSNGYFRENNYWKHIYYLGKDKQPLPKNIIVWMAK